MLFYFVETEPREFHVSGSIIFLSYVVRLCVMYHEL